MPVKGIHYPYPLHIDLLSHPLQLSPPPTLPGGGLTCVESGHILCTSDTEGGDTCLVFLSWPRDSKKGLGGTFGGTLGRGFWGTSGLKTKKRMWEHHSITGWIDLPLISILNTFESCYSVSLGRFCSQDRRARTSSCEWPPCCSYLWQWCPLFPPQTASWWALGSRYCNIEAR